MDDQVRANMISRGSGVGNVLTCKLCSKRSFTNGNKEAFMFFKTHIEGHLDIAHPCPYCSAVCTAVQYLHMHKKRQHLKDLEAEKTCLTPLRDKTKEYGVKPSVEDVLRQVLTRKRMINVEVREQTVAKNEEVVCKVCHRVFPRTIKNVMTIVKLHIEGHLNIKVNCPYCPSMFTKTSGLAVHKNKVHNKDFKAEQDLRNRQTKKYPCALCTKVWSSETYLTRHENRIHEKHKSKVVKTQKEIELMVDTELITKESGSTTEYKCRICCLTRISSNRNVKSQVKKHIEKHLNAFVSCNQCSDLFRSISILRLHRKEHYDKRRALESFSENDAKEMIKGHITAPTKECSKYLCKFCEFSVERDTANVHRLINLHVEIHLNLTIKCGHCPELEDFKSMRLLRHHKLKEHVTVQKILLRSISEKDAKELIKANIMLPIKEFSSYKCKFCELTLAKSKTNYRKINIHVENHLKMTIECGQCSEKVMFKSFSLLMQHKVKDHEHQLLSMIRRRNNYQ